MSQIDIIRVSYVKKRIEVRGRGVVLLGTVFMQGCQVPEELCSASRHDTLEFRIVSPSSTKQQHHVVTLHRPTIDIGHHGRR